MIRVLVVDDSAFMRRAISGMIESDPALTVVATARDGEDAVAKAIEHKPDFITLDIEMPKLDGLSALRRIMSECPTKVLMCSSLTKEGSMEALRAMKIGACDFIAKDASNVSATINDMRDELVGKIRAICGVTDEPKAVKPAAAAASTGHAHAGAASKSRVSRMIPRFNPGEFDLLVIGSSTGGPPVLETLLTELPADLGVPVVIAQHMPMLFTKSMSARLDQLSALTVVQGESGMPLLAGTVYIGVGGRHVRIVKSSAGRLALEVADNPAEALYKPSVNELFASAGKATGARTLAVMCTGMGDDGVIGARALRDAGGKLIAQNEATCVVYGMPKAVVDAGLAQWALPPDQIAQALSRLAPSHARGGGGHALAG